QLGDPRARFGQAFSALAEAEKARAARFGRVAAGPARRLVEIPARRAGEDGAGAGRGRPAVAGAARARGGREVAGRRGGGGGSAGRGAAREGGEAAGGDGH